MSDSPLPSKKAFSSVKTLQIPKNAVKTTVLLNIKICKTN